MIKRLQDISFRVSRYFRPLEEWHCGGTVDGKECLLGPDANGACRAVQDCSPELNQHTWVCTRSELLGGACQAGPGAHGECGRRRPPCKPVRSTRHRRSRFVWMVTAGAFALALLAVAVDQWQRPVNPGPLSKHHSAFGDADCSTCHAAAEMSKSTWLGSAEAAHQSSDDERCVSCHVLGEESLLVHALSPSSIQQFNAQALASQDSPLSGSFRLTMAKQFRGDAATSDLNDQPACATCHNEHGGSEAQLTQVSNQQCAVCHTQAFDSFAAHAEFKGYPTAQRTPIIFSHNSHLNKHFSDEEFSEFAPQACVACHQTDPIGRKMEVKGFDETCASCHASQVTGESRASDKGFALLTIPAIDVDSLKQRGVDIGAWPEYSDAEFTPFAGLLVSAIRPDLADKVAEFRTLDLFDLSSATDQELQLVYDMAWALKQVYFKLQRQGARSFSEQLARLVPDDQPLAPQLFGLLPPAVIDNAISDSFTDFEKEMLSWLESGTPEFALIEKPKQKAVEPVQTAEPEQQATAGDDLDDWLSSAASDEADDEDDWLSESALQESEEDSDDDWLAESAGDDGAEDDWLSGAADNDAGDSDDDWLSGALDEGDGDSEDDWLNDVAQDSSSALDDEQEEVEAVATSEVVEALSLEDRAAAGGWYYDAHALRYRPSGHADSLIVAWIERLSSAPISEPKQQAMLVSMQQSLLGDGTPGSCLKCHSADPQPNNQLMNINWFARKTAPSMHDFNAFTHQSHFSVVDLAENDFAATEDAGCRSCHRIDTEADSGAAYEDVTATYQSDFQDLNKSQCATCHADEPAMSSCVQCHNYHIGERTLTGIEHGFKQLLQANSSASEQTLE